MYAVSVNLKAVTARSGRVRLFSSLLLHLNWSIKHRSETKPVHG